MTRTLDRQVQGPAIPEERFRKLLFRRDQVMDSYLTLLGAMEKDLTGGKTLRLDQQVMAEGEMLLRLRQLQKVLSAPEFQNMEIPGDVATSHAEKERALELARHRCMAALEAHIAVVSRQLASIKAIPRRPAAFARIEQPSRLDITG